MSHGVPLEVLVQQMAAFLWPYYLALALMNGIAWYYLWKKTEPVTYFSFKLGDLTVAVTNAFVWLVVSCLYVLLAAIAASAGISGNMELLPQLPTWMSEGINRLTGPVAYSVGTTLVLLVLFLFRGFFVKPVVAWTIWNLMLVGLGLSMPDPDFYAIVAKPDNVPIVAMIFLLAFFNWLAVSRAVENDRRRDQGLPPVEKEDNEKVLVWPDLVYTELICMIALTALLIFWAILLRAPLEPPASAVDTPNPSKAPWYFLGLQEMLVYFDPWMAGVVLPSLIIVGLMAIPYLDFNKGGNGYYTIKERRFAYLVFQFGFLEMWVTLIVLGTLLRGPNWNFFGPYENWNAHKVEALNNVNLSEVFWQQWLGMSLPRPPDLAWLSTALPWFGLGDFLRPFVNFVCILFGRELPGTLLVLGYFIAVPPLLAVTLMRDFYKRMGFIRFMLLANLMLFMASLPIKMALRWMFNLKYLISIPEYFLNF